MISTKSFFTPTQRLSDQIHRELQDRLMRTGDLPTEVFVTRSVFQVMMEEKGYHGTSMEIAFMTELPFFQPGPIPGCPTYKKVRILPEIN